MRKAQSPESTKRPAAQSRRALMTSALVLGAAGASATLFAGSAVAQSGERKLMLATTKVEDVDRFLKIFSTTSLEKRKQHGSKGAIVFRDPNEADRVWVVFDWDDKGWQAFVSDPGVPPILKEAGHKGKPQVAQLGGQYGA